MTPFGFVVIAAGLLFASCALILALWGPISEWWGRDSRLRSARKWAEEHADEPARYGETLPEPLASLTGADLSADPAARELVHGRLREAAQKPPDNPGEEQPDPGDLSGAEHDEDPWTRHYHIRSGRGLEIRHPHPAQRRAHEGRATKEGEHIDTIVFPIGGLKVTEVVVGGEEEGPVFVEVHTEEPQERRSDRFTAVEERHANYTVYDNSGSKIGKVDDLFLDEDDRPEYFGVKMGFLGTSSTLIPAEIAATDEANSSITVSSDKETVKNGPAFADDRGITPEYEDEVRSYYGLDAATGSGSYGEATEAQIGEDEVEVPVTEEEVVVHKRAVAKEEVRVRKDVVEDTEVVEEDVRREEVDAEDASTTRRTNDADA